ncbi:hypothetical protein KUH32_04195 [Thalassococcus sp. CAU 1522]|uniref:Uncharacterized protein n=1 Tax=Thalassococcus arenae TaxID=2851652 RepID=A0ABS6N4P0_9RHOB|nr:hypothetical protein [Thalassococcus arenae]MBV2358966.1 hypothetical protein [Thalassococcus arenae]
MRPTAPLLALVLLPLPLAADPCRDRIAAMFDGGALDPFARPPHRYVMTTTGPDGAVKSIYHAVFETPIRSLGWTEGAGMQSLILGSDSWIRMAEDQPWMAAPNMVPADHEGFARAQRAQQRANLDDTACPGTADLDGTEVEIVRYFTRTDPNPEAGGAWFGSANTVFIDPATGRVLRWEVTDAVSSFSPDPSPDIQVLVYTYDDTIALSEPDG